MRSGIWNLDPGMGHLSDVGCRKGVLSNLESGVWNLDVQKKFGRQKNIHEIDLEGHEKNVYLKKKLESGVWTSKKKMESLYCFLQK